MTSSAPADGRLVRRYAAGLVALLVATVALSGCDGGAGSPGGRSDDFVGGQADVIEGSTSEVVVPTGTVEIEVAEPRRSLTATETSDRQARTAPDGQVYLGVDWQFLPGVGLPDWWHVLMADPEQRITLTLRSGGETVALGDALPVADTPPDTNTSGDFFVLVQESADDVQVEVSFDGLTQVVGARTGDRESGDASVLYGASDPRPRPCDAAPTRRTRALTTSCSLLTTRIPYLPGHGWSESGWQAVMLTTTTESREANRQQVKSITDASRFDGEKPVTSQVADEAEGVLSTTPIGSPTSRRLEIAREVFYRDADGAIRRLEIVGAAKL